MLLLSFILFQNDKSSKFLCSVYYSNFEVYRFIYEDIFKILINFNVIKFFLFQQVSLKINVFSATINNVLKYHMLVISTPIHLFVEQLNHIDLNYNWNQIMVRM